MQHNRRDCIGTDVCQKERNQDLCSFFQMSFRLAGPQMQTVRGTAGLRPRNLSRTFGVSMRSGLDRTALSNA